MRTNRRRQLGLALLRAGGAVALVLAAVGPPTTRAASPAPEPSGSPEVRVVIDPSIEVWLDEPFAEGVAPGERRSVGFVLWDGAGAKLMRDATPFIRLRSPTQAPRADGAIAAETSPGHFVGEVVGADDGQGALEIGFPGMLCEGPSGCFEVDNVFPIGGIGVPPAARLTSLLVATIQPPPGPVAAGQPVEVVVDLALVGPWEPEEVDLPERLFVLQSVSRDEDLSAVIRPSADDPLRYSGPLSFPEARKWTIDVSTEPDRNASVIFPGSAVDVVVAPSEAAAAPTNGLPPLAIVAMGVAGLVALGLIVRRLIRDF